jgi:excisionase family DNA binding protein
VWRRVVKEGGGPELTLPEAAVLLGTSVESVRRRIKAGKIHAFRDDRGRVRIRATVPGPAAAAALAVEAGESPQVAALWEELKTTKNGLDAAEWEAQELRQELGLAHYHRREAHDELVSLQDQTQELRAELSTAQEALKHSQTELAAMWRVMSARKERAGEHLLEMTDGNEAFDLAPARERLGGERERIQEQITRVRDLSKQRRRWPWPQAS